MKYSEIAVVINANAESFRKKLVGYKRAHKFLQNFDPKKYYKITLSLSVFQKINTSDWNEVLIKFGNRKK